MDRLRELCVKLMFLHPVDYGRKAEELLWRKVYYEVIQVIKTNKKVLLNHYPSYQLGTDSGVYMLLTVCFNDICLTFSFAFSLAFFPSLFFILLMNSFNSPFLIQFLSLSSCLLSNLSSSRSFGEQVQKAPLGNRTNFFF